MKIEDVKNSKDFAKYHYLSEAEMQTLESTLKPLVEAATNFEDFENAALDIAPINACHDPEWIEILIGADDDDDLRYYSGSIAYGVIEESLKIFWRIWRNKNDD